MGGGQESVVREDEGGRDSGGEAEGDREGDGSTRRREKEEQEPPEKLQRGEDDGRPKRKRARGVRYGEEESKEPGTLGEGMTVYGPHKVRGKWRMYMGTVGEMIVQKDRAEHETKAAIVQWEYQGEVDGVRLLYLVESLRVLSARIKDGDTGAVRSEAGGARAGGR